jgi:hypothetical protein
MSSALVLGGMRKKVLGAAVTLTVAGFTSLGLTSNNPDVPFPKFVAPTYGTNSPFSFDSLLPTTTATSAALELRRALTTVGGYYLDPTTTGPGTSTTNPPQQPPTQVDAAVPAAGAQVSFGQGPGSCTDVAITALTPDDCPPPPGDGPVIVDPGPSSDNLIGGPGKAGFTTA